MADSGGPTNGEKPKRRWWQFTLASLLVLMTAIALCLGFWADSARRQKHTVEWIKSHDGDVLYSWEIQTSPTQIPSPPGPEWLREWLGIDFVDHVGHVFVRDESITDADLATLARDLPHLTAFEIADAPNVTDAGVARLASCRKLERLRLGCPQMTGTALARLAQPRQLDNLYLESDHITDADLVHLRPLKKLYHLKLNCPVTDAGMEHLTGLTNLIRLGFYGAPSDTARRKIAEALGETTAAEFIDEPLEGVCEYFADYHQIKFRIDKQTIKAAQRDPNQAITAQCAGGTRLAEALTTILQPHGLGWYVGDGEIVITTAEVDAERHAGVNKLRKTLPKLQKFQYCW